MSDRACSKSVHNALGQYLSDRSDLGVGKAVCDALFEPVNPFAPKAARLPRRWFVLFALLAGTLLGCFVYFNNLI
jgi:hypothetical protein